MTSALFAPRRLNAAPAPAGRKGVGVFALCEIEAGELVDVSLCIDLDAAACDRLRDTPVDDYYFRHPGDDERGLLVLGLASLCNHDDDANVETRFVHDASVGWIVVLEATRRIAHGEEITRRYACPPWFALHAET